jgi:hypothetical protein
MPLIKPRTRGKQLVRRMVRLDRETNETLFAYAHFLGESTDYVLNEVIDTVLARDKEFQAWRAEHTASFVPPSPAGQPVKKRRSRRRAEPPPAAADAPAEPSVTHA